MHVYHICFPKATGLYKTLKCTKMQYDTDSSRQTDQTLLYTPGEETKRTITELWERLGWLKLADGRFVGDNYHGVIHQQRFQILEDSQVVCSTAKPARSVKPWFWKVAVYRITGFTCSSLVAGKQGRKARRNFIG